MPRFRQELEGLIVLSQNVIEEEEESVTFERCCGVPISKYSVLDGFTVRRLLVSQVWTELSTEEM